MALIPSQQFYLVKVRPAIEQTFGPSLVIADVMAVSTAILAPAYAVGQVVIMGRGQGVPADETDGTTVGLFVTEELIFGRVT